MLCPVKSRHCSVQRPDAVAWAGRERRWMGDLPLAQPKMFQEVLQRCVDMENAEYLKWSEKALEYGLQVTRDDGVVEQNRKLFYKIGQMKCAE